MNKKKALIPILVGVAAIILGGILFILNKAPKSPIVIDLSEDAIIKINKKEENCIGNNTQIKDIDINIPLKKITVSHGFNLTKIYDIDSIKLISKKAGFSLNCTLILPAKDINCVAPKELQYIPGKYTLRVPRYKKAGTNESVLINKYTSKNSFTITDKIYTKFNKKKIEETAAFKTSDKEYILTLKYSDKLTDVPKLVLKDKEIKCNLDGYKNKTIQCHIPKKLYPPTKLGTKFEGTLFNICGEKESDVFITSKIDDSDEKRKYFLTKILPIILLVLVGGAAIGVGVLMALKKKKQNKPNVNPKVPLDNKNKDLKNIPKNIKEKAKPAAKPAAKPVKDKLNKIE